MKPPITSGSKNGIDHPPWVKPPSVSSSGPPGACTTPSRLMNSLITIRMQVGPCHESELIARTSKRERDVLASGCEELVLVALVHRRVEAHEPHRVHPGEGRPHGVHRDVGRLGHRVPVGPRADG